MHYARWQRTGDPLKTLLELRPKLSCLFEGCEKEVRARNLCVTHLWRLNNHGSIDDPTPTEEQRFLEKLSAPDANGCRVWLANRNIFGYGRFSQNGHGVMAHRWSYEHFVGPIPEGQHVCHRCDNRPCCEPTHLFVGTAADNIHDCIAKGRTNPALGEGHYAAKLTDDFIREIRRLAQDETQTDIARRFGVDPSTISLIVRRKRWAHVA